MKSYRQFESQRHEAALVGRDLIRYRRLSRIFSDKAVRRALIIFVVIRLFTILWAGVITTIQPVPTEVDERLRPYLGAAILHEGVAGTILGPWQRFDTMRYARIANYGYENVEDSVFPPLYPLLINGLSRPFSLVFQEHKALLIAGIVISNISFIGALTLLYKVTESTFSDRAAQRSLTYFALFPAAFFLVAAYSESLFIALSLGSIWSARKRRFWLAGALAFLAALTRITGALLVVPLIYEYLLQRGFNWRKPFSIEWRRLDINGLAAFLPVAGAAAFLLYRSAVGLPPLGEVYRQFWYQTTGFPGRDMFTALNKIIGGGAPFRLFFDLFIAILLIGATWFSFRKMPVTYGLYSASLLLFILLPTSDLKPLYSFSRYALAFFPMFMLFGQAGRNPWINRLILYPSLALYLYSCGQFFMWGWVA